jgi:hypothetical protein
VRILRKIFEWRHTEIKHLFRRNTTRYQNCIVMFINNDFSFCDQQYKSFECQQTHSKNKCWCGHSTIQFNSIQFNSIQFNSIQLKTNEMILMYVLDFLLHQTHNKNDNLFRRSCHWVLDVDRPTYDFPMVQWKSLLFRSLLRILQCSDQQIWIVFKF